MASELLMGLGAFKTMFDLAKGLKDINDAATRNAVAIELQEKILTAQAQQAELVERVRALEAEVAGFEKWEAEKLRYELKEITPRAFAYLLKEDARGAEPLHWICPSCYQQDKKSILQGFESAMIGWTHKCPSCKLEFQI